MSMQLLLMNPLLRTLSVCLPLLGSPPVAHATFLSEQAPIT